MQDPLASSYEVIVIGGRPAGASLAARLGALGRSVLVIDKAKMPSAPAVPSCPLLYPQAVAQLDGLGIPPEAYAHAAIAVRDVVLQFGEHFDAPMRTIQSRGVDCVYGVDREGFDAVLWRNLARFPSVTARDECAMADLLWDGPRVAGVEVRGPDGALSRVRARIVAGADGRFSPLARKVSAKIIEDRPEHQSTLFFADWQGVAPHRGEDAPIVHVYATGRGKDVLFFPMPGGRVTVCTHERADRVQTGGDAEKHYLDAISSLPGVARRLADARRVSDVVGMKKVANRYLEAHGPGWVLVGDAMHHKDPVDGQGIYDALVETELLTTALSALLGGEKSEEEALGWYAQRAREETRPMFLATMARLQTELYSEPPEIVIRTLIRWMMTDPEYQERFLRYLCREIDPNGWRSGGLVARTVLRGAMRDIRRLFQGRSP